MVSFSLVTAPSVEPVLLADAKAHARIDTSADDSLVTNLIVAARHWAEKYTGRAFITQSWQLVVDSVLASDEQWWDGVRQGAIIALDAVRYISLPRAPLQSVTSVQVFDDTDTATVWAASNYFVDTVAKPGRIALRTGATWPVAARLTNGIVITYVAGYGADGSSVPEPIKTAIRQLVAHWYEHRGEAAITRATNATMVPMVIQALLEPYRIRYSGV